METQIQSFYRSPQGLKFVSLFGYATKGVPGLEISGVGKLSKNMREKITFLSRSRRLPIPLRRYVLCVDVNEIADCDKESLKWLEFPMLLLYWHMAGLVPISKLSDCLCSGWVKTNGEIIQMNTPRNFSKLVQEQFQTSGIKDLKIIDQPRYEESSLWLIESSLLLEHIERLTFRKELATTPSKRSDQIPNLAGLQILNSP